MVIGRPRNRDIQSLTSKTENRRRSSYETYVQEHLDRSNQSEEKSAFNWGEQSKESRFVADSGEFGKGIGTE